MTPEPVQTPTEPAAIPVSPTGQPMLSAKLTPYFAAAAALCGVIAGASQIPGLNLPASVFGWATLVAALFGTLAGMTPGLRKIVPVMLVILGLSFSCQSAETPFLISGDTLEAAGHTYDSTVDTMMNAYHTNLINQDQYHKFVLFGQRFDASYQLAVALWKSARDAQDVASQGHAEQIITQLLGELQDYTILIMNLVHPKGSP